MPVSMAIAQSARIRAARGVIASPAPRVDIAFFEGDEGLRGTDNEQAGTKRKLGNSDLRRSMNVEVLVWHANVTHVIAFPLDRSGVFRPKTV
jgi:hypothetical protein